MLKIRFLAVILLIVSGSFAHAAQVDVCTVEEVFNTNDIPGEEFIHNGVCNVERPGSVLIDAPRFSSFLTHL